MDSEEIGPKKNNDGMLLEQWKIANNLKMHEDHLLWFISSIFWAANALLLVALFQTSSQFFTLMKWIIIPLFGLGLSIFWYLVGAHVLGYTFFYENLVGRIEEILISDLEFRTGWDNKKHYHKYITGMRLKPKMKYIPVIGIIGWISGLFFGILLIILALIRC